MAFLQRVSTKNVLMHSVGSGSGFYPVKVRAFCGKDIPQGCLEPEDLGALWNVLKGVPLA